MGGLLAGTIPLSAQSGSEVKEEEGWKKRIEIARNFLAQFLKNRFTLSS